MLIPFILKLLGLGEATDEILLSPLNALQRHIYNFLFFRFLVAAPDKGESFDNSECNKHMIEVSWHTAKYFTDWLNWNSP